MSRVAPSERLNGSHAIVTGAASGIGLAIAHAFAAAGARVLLTDVQEVDGERVAASLGGEATFRRLDVTLERDWTDLIGEIDGDPPDILVNNAGGLLDAQVLHETSVDTWEKTIRLNLTSVFLGMRAVLPLMVARRSGSIVNVASVSGIAGQPDAPAYQAAKAGVLLLTKNGAVTYGGTGVRINALTPSVVATPALASETDARTDSFIAKVPLGRPATPSEVAAGALFLASSDASYVNGTNLVVDGGYLA